MPYFLHRAWCRPRGVASSKGCRASLVKLGGLNQVARPAQRASALTRSSAGKPLEAKAQQGAGQDDMNNIALVFEERHRRRQGN